MTKRLAMGLLAALVLAACGEAEVATGDEFVDESSDAFATIDPRNVETTPLWFGTPNSAVASSSGGTFNGQFDLLPGGKITLTVSGTPGSAVGFKLSRVKANGLLQLSNRVEGRNGQATLSFRSRSGGTYVVTAAPTAEQPLTVDLTCQLGKGKCSPQSHVGESCGGRGTKPCADDLFCNHVPGQLCGRADAAGTCAVRPRFCTAVYRPVCGCDGQTHGNACSAAAAGVGVDHTGACTP